MAQILIPITVSATKVLKAWIQRRVEERQAYRVYIDGTEFVGYSAAELARLLAAIDACLEEQDESA